MYFLQALIYASLSAFMIRNYLMKFTFLLRHPLVFIICCQRGPVPRPSAPNASLVFSIFVPFFFVDFLFIYFFSCLCHFCGYHKLVRRATFPMWKIEMCFFPSWPRSRGHAHRPLDWGAANDGRTQDGSCGKIR